LYPTEFMDDIKRIRTDKFPAVIAYGLYLLYLNSRSYKLLVSESLEPIIKRNHTYITCPYLKMSIEISNVADIRFAVGTSDISFKKIIKKAAAWSDY
jgi:hypothetical protein